MTIQYWLVKQEPESYPWSQFVADRKTEWTGVRNFQARNNLKAMQKGDAVLFYVSGGPKEVVGLAQVSKSAFPDPTAESGEDWVAVELKAGKALARPVPLTRIKAEPNLKSLPLIRHTRLSVIPVSKAEFDTIVRLGS
ncbi:MAG: EVE domain-containing protein [Opitutaceae bacterium]|nr:EVE domain-containing protein [Opitutaceae bacterium]